MNPTRDRGPDPREATKIVPPATSAERATKDRKKVPLIIEAMAPPPEAPLVERAEALGELDEDDDEDSVSSSEPEAIAPPDDPMEH